MTFTFGGSDRERVEVDILRYERKPVGEYWDDNWLTVQVSVHAGEFHGKVNAAIFTGELVAFMNQLRPLFETLRGSAEFTTMEGQLKMRLIGDGKGHIELRGEAADEPGVGNLLSFILRFDQSQLGRSTHELEKVIAEFPVRK